MNMKKITSLTALISFLVLILNSVVLYIVPHSRVANWADWRLWGLSKTDWGNQHIIIGVLFLIAIFLHIYYNWKPMVSYLKNKAKQLKFFTRNFNIALIVTIICVIGSYFTVPPFNWVLDFSESIKNNAEVTYGSPPYGHAELSTLKGFARRVGINLTDGLEKLQKAGIKVESEKQTLIDIAKLNKISPQKVFMIIKPEETNGASEKLTKMSVDPAPGTGQKTVEDVCKIYGLDINTIMKGFVVHNIKATADMSLKAIGEQNSMGPDEVYGIIKNIAETTPPPTSDVTAPETIEKGATPKDDAPLGLGRLTLAEACDSIGITQNHALKRLAGKGIIALPGDKMRRISDKYDKTPRDLYEIIK